MSGLPGPWQDAPVGKRYVLGFLFSLNEVLLLCKAAPEWQRGRLNGVGGHIEVGESPVEAMVREFQEETQVVTIPDQWEHFATLTASDHAQSGPFTMWCFRMDVPPPRVAGMPNPLSRGVHPKGSTAEPVQWAYVNHLPDEVMPNLRWLVPAAYYGHRADWPLLVVERAGGIE